MARDLFIDLTNNRLAASETNLAPAAPPVFTKGDNGTFNLYFLQATGVINAPFTVVDRASTSIKFGIGSRSLLPETGDYTLTFGGDTTSSIPAAATAGQVATALNALSAISSAGGVTVTGALDDHFTIRFTTAGTRGSFTADVSQIIPDTVAVIDERLAGSATVKEVAELQLRLTPAVFQPTWTNLSTAVTATIATTVTGSGIQNEIQRLTFSQEPFAGTFRLTFPDIALTSNSTVTAGVFVTSVTHGLALNQPITITGFDTTITGFTRGSTVFINSIPSTTSFLVAATAGGTTITTAQATAATTAGSIATFLRQTDPLAASAVAADIATALQAFDSIGAGGVSVAGIDGEFADITFGGDKGFCDQPTLTIQSGLTAKPGKTADVNFATFALRDLVGSSNAVDLDLEIELTDSGTRQTVILSGCAVSEELIDANAFSPVVSDDMLVISPSVNTQNNIALTNTQSAVTNSALVLTPKGNGAIIVGPRPDGTSIGGNARGAAAVDLQSVRSSASAVASGEISAVAGGEDNTASGLYSAVAGGESNTASGLYSAVAGGAGNAASGQASAVAGGVTAVASKFAQQAYAAGSFANYGDAQRSNYILRRATANDTPAELFLDGSGARLTLIANQAIAFTAQLVGSRQGHADNAYFTRRGLVVNDGGTTTLVGSIETLGTDQKSAGASAATFAVTADDTNDSIKFEITSITGQNWRWVASVDAVEVSFP